MSPYFEMDKRPLDEIKVRALNPGETVIGRIDKNPVEVTVIDHQSVDFKSGDGSVVLEETEGSMVFDREGSRIGGHQRGIVYLNLEETAKLASLVIEFHDFSPGALQDSFDSLWKKMEIDTGRQAAGKWSLGRALSAILSAGRTEDFTKDL